MRTACLVILSSLAALALMSCQGHLPPLETSRGYPGPKVQDIQNEIGCELATLVNYDKDKPNDDAIAKRVLEEADDKSTAIIDGDGNKISLADLLSYLKKYHFVASAQLSLEVTDSEGISPSLSFPNKQMTGTAPSLTSLFGAQLTGTQDRSLTFSYAIDMNSLVGKKGQYCVVPQKTAGTQLMENFGLNGGIAGDLGLREIVEDGLLQLNDSQVANLYGSAGPTPPTTARIISLRGQAIPDPNTASANTMTIDSIIGSLVFAPQGAGVSTQGTVNLTGIATLHDGTHYIANWSGSIIPPDSDLTHPVAFTLTGNLTAETETDPGLATKVKDNRKAWGFVPTVSLSGTIDKYFNTASLTMSGLITPGAPIPATSALPSLLSLKSAVPVTLSQATAVSTSAGQIDIHALSGTLTFTGPSRNSAAAIDVTFILKELVLLVDGVPLAIPSTVLRGAMIPPNILSNDPFRLLLGARLTLPSAHNVDEQRAIAHIVSAWGPTPIINFDGTSNESFSPISGGVTLSGNGNTSASLPLANAIFVNIVISQNADEPDLGGLIRLQTLEGTLAITQSPLDTTDGTAPISLVTKQLVFTGTGATLTAPSIGFQGQVVADKSNPSAPFRITLTSPLRLASPTTESEKTLHDQVVQRWGELALQGSADHSFSSINWRIVLNPIRRDGAFVALAPSAAGIGASAGASGSGGGGSGAAKGIAAATGSAGTSSFGSIVDFTLVFGLNGGPSWTFSKVKGPAQGSSPLATATRTNLDSLSITFVPACQDYVQSPRVVRTFWDSIGSCNEVGSAAAADAAYQQNRTMFLTNELQRPANTLP